MKKVVALLLLFVLAVTSFPLESSANKAMPNCSLKCFTSGTPVQTAEGLKPIEKIKVGDFVLTRDETTGKVEYNPVVSLYQRVADETYTITAKGVTFTTTGDHPFWVQGKGWVEAQDLKVGDRLQNTEGIPYSIDRIEYKKGKAEVYNFQVQGVHNYFVTQLKIWVHNCGGGRALPPNSSLMMMSSGGGGGGSSSAKPSSTGTTSSPKYVPKDQNGNALPLPKTPDGKIVNGTTHIPESMKPHTQIGTQKGRKGDYPQTLEWGENGVPVKRTDWTDHGRPQNHTNPHHHYPEFKNGSWSF